MKCVLAFFCVKAFIIYVLKIVVAYVYHFLGNVADIFLIFVDSNFINHSQSLPVIFLSLILF